MNEQQFLAELNVALSRLPEEERKDVIQDIREYFMDGKEDGKTEEELSASLGSPQAIASEILPSFPIETETIHSETREVIKISEPYMNIRTNVQHGSLIVKPSDTDETKVELTGKNDKLRLTAEVIGQTLTINLKDVRRFFSFSFNFTPITLTVHVPKKLYEMIELYTDNGRIMAEKLLGKTFKAESDNGRIQLQAIAATTLSAETDNGRIEMANIQAEHVRAKTDNGRIELNHVDSQKVTAESDNGRIEMVNIAGALYGKTDNGRITLKTSGLDRNIDFSTDNGSIVIETEKEPTNVTIMAKTGHGRIDVFGEKNSRTSIGQGVNIVKLESDNGRITVTTNKTINTI
ncbi:DUF4097 family beta strand repeat-containing protein [Chungangia koreensis]|uniref:DUF4097 family beta strand repeat-containing protein n=1 Tax=Chungangia koreensis TaxID=752657 RepID=A0ABV8X368_9LACT